MAILVNLLALAGSFLSVSMLLPVLVALGHGQGEAAGLLGLQAVLAGFLFISVMLAARGRPGQIDRLGGAVLALAIWLMAPLLAAIPMMHLFDIGYGHALFESVSAFTTTAADSASPPSASRETAIFFRAQLQWMGGLATILTFILFFGPIRAGGLPRTRGGFGEGTLKSGAGIQRIALQVLRTYVLATLACFALLMLAGAGEFPSAILAMSALSTGGYGPEDRPLLDTVPGMALVVTGCFLLFSATSVFWHRMFFRFEKDSLLRHRESYFVIGAALVLSAAFFVAITSVSGGATGEDAPAVLTEAFFNAASVVSTSGLETRPGVFALLPEMLVLAIILIGAGSYSTAGGIKFYRFGAMLFHARAELLRMIYPNALPKTRFGGEPYGPELMKPVWTMVAIALAIVSLGALALAVTGMDFHASLTASAAAFANSGPAYSPEWVARGTPGWPTYDEMDGWQMSVIATIMMLGRLEIVVIAALINPAFWLRR